MTFASEEKWAIDSKPQIQTNDFLIHNFNDLTNQLDISISIRAIQRR